MPSAEDTEQFNYFVVFCHLQILAGEVEKIRRKKRRRITSTRGESYIMCLSVFCITYSRRKRKKSYIYETL